ncbi:MAG: glutaredoxin family protein [Aquabacterium sp.]
MILLIVLGGHQAWNWWRDERSAALIQQHAGQAEITLYTTSTCPYCARARAWLEAHGIAWRECNVETDAACMARYEAQGAPGVPLVHVAGRWHLGFDPAWLGQVLSASPAGASVAAPTGAAQSNPSLASSPRP